jgi:uncharacterized repeat protein (TIGR02543 family)
MSGGKIFDNISKGDVGGLLAEDSLDMSGGEVYENTSATYAGGIYSAASTTISDGSIHDNVAATMGGGLFLDNSTATISNIEIANNSAGEGGGLYMSGGNVTLNSGEVSENQATRGGGIYNDGGTLSIQGSTIKENIATAAFDGITGSGGGIFSSVLTNLTIANGTLFTDNKAEYGYTEHMTTDDTLYSSNILGANWTTPFTQGYNNFDIGYHGTDPVHHIVNFYMNDGTKTIVKTIAVADKSTIASEMPAEPTLSGHIFAGWNSSEDGNGTIFDENTVITDDANVYAVWTRASTPNSVDADYKVNHYLVSSKGTKLMDSLTYNDTIGKSVTAASRSYTGYTYFPSHSGEVKSGTVLANGNLILKLYYQINKFTVTFKDHNGDILKAQTVEYGKDASAPKDPTRRGYTFTGWSKSSSAWQNVTSNVTVRAEYEKKDSGTTNPQDDDQYVDEDGSDDNNTYNAETVVATTDTQAKPDKAAEDSDYTVNRVVTTDNTKKEDVLSPDEEILNGMPHFHLGKKTVPLFAPLGVHTWALVNLLMCVLALIFTIITVTRKVDGNDAGRSKLLVSILASVASILLFLATQNIKATMVLTDIWTIVHIVIVGATFLIMARPHNHEYYEDHQ